MKIKVKSVILSALMIGVLFLVCMGMMSLTEAIFSSLVLIFFKMSDGL